MKVFTHALVAFLTIMLFSGCSSSKENIISHDFYNLTETPPFNIVEAYSQKWIAGVQGGGSGTNIFIKFDNIKGDITINDVYFQDNITPLKLLAINSMAYQATIKGDVNNDIIMDGDPYKESTNTPPVKIPFVLAENEAVLSYLENNKLKFFKISALPEKPMIAYPSANPDNKQ